jgi:hypothetical protein
MIGRNDVVWKGFYMGRRNRKNEILGRLNSKTLDAPFLHEIQYGLNCSPFEAEAVLDVAKETYLPFQDEQSIKAPPGKITLTAVSADKPAGKPLAACEKQNVCLTVHRGNEDKAPQRCTLSVRSMPGDGQEHWLGPVLLPSHPSSGFKAKNLLN